MQHNSDEFVEMLTKSVMKVIVPEDVIPGENIAERNDPRTCSDCGLSLRGGPHTCPRDELKISIIYNGREIGCFTLHPDVAAHLLDGKVIDGYIGGYDANIGAFATGHFSKRKERKAIERLAQMDAPPICRIIDKLEAEKKLALAKYTPREYALGKIDGLDYAIAAMGDASTRKDEECTGTTGSATSASALRPSPATDTLIQKAFETAYNDWNGDYAKYKDGEYINTAQQRTYVVFEKGWKAGHMVGCEITDKMFPSEVAENKFDFNAFVKIVDKLPEFGISQIAASELIGAYENAKTMREYGEDADKDRICPLCHERWDPQEARNKILNSTNQKSTAIDDELVRALNCNAFHEAEKEHSLNRQAGLMNRDVLFRTIIEILRPYLKRESVDHTKLLAGVIKRGLELKGGWREAIVELEDHCSEPVRLNNMIAAADQLDGWAKDARQALTQIEDGSHE